MATLPKNPLTKRAHNMTTIYLATKAVKKYLISNMDVAGYDLPAAKNEQELIAQVYNIFKSEYGYMVQRLGELEAIKEWLMGLPSSVSIVFSYYDIEVKLNEFDMLHEHSKNETKERLVTDWFQILACNLYKLFKKGEK